MKTARTCPWEYSGTVRLGASVLCGLAAGLLAYVGGHRQFAPLIGWDVTAVVFIAWVGLTVFRLRRAETAELASAEDGDWIASEFLMVAASVASLVAVGLALFEAGNRDGSAKWELVAFGVLSVVLSWAIVHTIFTLRYARLYYSDKKGGLDFKMDNDPSYLDFAYVAFTIGMTFQVADTDINQRKFRRAILGHAMLSYLFGTVIVATTINLVAGLVK
jgi:uncharacterized membrane protein